MTKTGSWMLIGRLGRTKGLKGEIYCDLFNPESDALSHVEEVKVGDPAKGKSFAISTVHGTGSRYVLTFESLRSIDAVKPLVGKELFVAREDLPAPKNGEYYISDLIGLSVKSMDGKSVGTLTSVMPTPANDVYVVQTETEELLLPAIPSVVQKIDLKDKTIWVVVPEHIDAF